MAEPIGIQQLKDASLDVKSLEEVVNGGENVVVTTRLGETYPSVKGSIKKLFENGGLPATPFKTKALMTASALGDGEYAQVTDDTVNNGLYVKEAGAWVKSNYDITTMFGSFGELTYPVVGSDVKSKKLSDVTATTQPLNGGTAGALSATSVGKFSYVVPVKPNTTYTILTQGLITRPKYRFFNKEPESWDRYLLADGYIDPPTLTLLGGKRYGEIPVPANRNYLVIDPIVYTTARFIVVEGNYNPEMWDSFEETTTEKTANFDTIIADVVKSNSFVDSKNLVKALHFGLGVNPTAAIGATTTQAYISRQDAGTPTYQKAVGAFATIKPNTTYTISKDPSDEFSVVVMNAAKNSARVLLRDNSKTLFTFTSGATDELLYMDVSNNYQQPLVQVEEGDKATEYLSYGKKFKEAALPPSRVLGSPQSSGGEQAQVQQTDNTYIDLGIQTGKWQGVQYTTDTILNEYYEPLLEDFPHLVTKKLLGKDSSGLYDIYEYVFEPDAYEQTIMLTSGMHPTEFVPPFALGTLINEIYRNPSKHEGLAYLRNKVKIVVIPVVNVWGMNQNPRSQPLHYNNFNGVNINRNFPARFEVNPAVGEYNPKGAYALSEIETRHMFNVMNREKDELAFYIDLHTGEQWEMDSMAYYLDEDDFLRPEFDKVVSMQKDIVRASGRVPKTEVMESYRVTSIYYAWRVLGVPASTIEYGTVGTSSLDSTQMTYYVNQIFNFIHYALKARLKEKRVQAQQNEQNKPFLSLYNTLAGHNNVINEVWTYAQWQTNLYDKLGLTRSVMGAASGTYELVKYTHSPSSYKNTVVLSAGLNNNRKAVTELGFIAHKLMTDKNPHIVALRASTRFVFIPCLNPYGFDEDTLNNANAVQPFVDFATSTQPEAIALRSFIDIGNVDLYIDMDSSINTSKPAGYTNLQVIFNNKADAVYQSIFSVLNNKYGITSPSNAKPVANIAPRSPLTTYINTKPIAYEYVYIAQNVLPKRNTEEGLYVDYGYEADELAYNAEVILNSIKALNEKLMLVKYLSA